MVATLVRVLKQTSRLALRSSVNFARAISTRHSDPNFGIMFDVDGVLIRGKKVLPWAPEAFAKLVNNEGKFRVPSIFVTNAGNTTRLSKAEQLSEWLKVHISEDQVIMAHSPLKMFNEFHSKRVLVVGQGPVTDIAASIGFKHVTTIEDLRHAFPSLDAVDHRRRRVAPCAFDEYFPPLEAIVLFGEPIRWETALQLIIDVLVTNGHPSRAPKFYPSKHLPVLACNMDLQWMAESVMPRFGHGAFLFCLENLYKKITGHDLIYTALIGKPSEITYIHSEHMLQNEATKIGLKQPVKNIYCIGDNVCTDIFGANLYNRYLERKRQLMNSPRFQRMAQSTSTNYHSRSIEQFIGFESDELSGAERCASILVETGVYSPDGDFDSQISQLLSNHSPRDFLPVEKVHQQPTYVVDNVLSAVNLIFDKENF